jgi:hypothetical protein
MLDSFDAGNDFEHKLSSAGSGSSLDGKTRSEMEAGIGADFSQVRIHTGAHASSLNRSISAKAFTRGSDVFFDKGQYNPGSTAGKRLIAHELTHVVQQGAATQNTQRKAYPNASIQRWPWSKKKDKPKTQNDSATPSNDEGEQVNETPSNTNEESDTLSIAPDYSNRAVQDQAPTRFKYTVLVWQQNKNYLYMQKVRAWTTFRNTLRKFARNTLKMGGVVRTPKTSAEMKTKTARKVAELDPTYGNMTDEQKANEIKKIEGQTRQMGHTWSRLTAYSGDNLKEIYSFGFWPAYGINRPDEATEGEVMHPDQEHDGDSPIRVMHYDIPAKNYNTALKWADSQVQNPPQYKMIGLNCTSWSRMLAGKAGVSFPSSGNVFPAEPAQGFFQRIFSPNKLYNDMGKTKEVEDTIDEVPTVVRGGGAISIAPQEEVGGGVLQLPEGKTLTLRDLMGGGDLAELGNGTRIVIEDENWPNVDDYSNVMVRVISSNKHGVLYADELKAHYKEGGSIGGITFAEDESETTSEGYELPAAKSIHTLTNPLNVNTSRGRRTIPAGLKIMVTDPVAQDEIHLESERFGSSGDCIRGMTDAKSFHEAVVTGTSQQDELPTTQSTVESQTDRLEDYLTENQIATLKATNDDIQYAVDMGIVDADVLQSLSQELVEELADKIGLDEAVLRRMIGELT